jgi:hypothetical protein
MAKNPGTFLEDVNIPIWKASDVIGLTKIHLIMCAQIPDVTAKVNHLF